MTAGNEEGEERELWRFVLGKQRRESVRLHMVDANEGNTTRDRERFSGRCADGETPHHAWSAGIPYPIEICDFQSSVFQGALYR